MHRLFGVFCAACVLASSTARADELAPRVQEAFELRPFVSPLDLVTAIEFLPDGRLVITEKGGRVLVRRPNGNVVTAAQLDADDRTEKGLLNVIKHPRFEENHELIFYYSAASAPEHDKHKVVRIRLGDDDRLDVSTERVLLHGLRGPDDHEQGGGLAIDAKGYLLVGVGDSGCRARKKPEPPYTPANYFATCLENGNGKILRIDLDGNVPQDNPLGAVDAATACGDACGDDPFGLPLRPPRRDIWVWGVRNPWRIWVDPRTGWVWFGDVGDIGYEEINVISPLGNAHYGWPWREGPAGHPVETCKKVTPDRGDCVEPVYACGRGAAEGGIDGDCKSINGGLIVDDCRWPEEYRHQYYFGDNANGRVWTLTPTSDRRGVVSGSRRDFGRVDGFVVDSEVGPDGALYVAVMSVPPGVSRIVRIAPRAPVPCETASAVGSAAGQSAPRAATANEPGAVQEPEQTVRPAALTRRRTLLGLAALLVLVVAVVVVRDQRI